MQLVLAMALALGALPSLQVDVAPRGPESQLLRDALLDRLKDLPAGVPGLAVRLDRTPSGWRLEVRRPDGTDGLVRDLPPSSTAEYLAASVALMVERHLRALDGGPAPQPELTRPVDPPERSAQWEWAPGLGLVAELGIAPSSSQLGLVLSAQAREVSGVVLGLHLRLLMPPANPLASTDPAYAAASPGELRLASAEALAFAGLQPDLPFHATLGLAAGPSLCWAWAGSSALERRETRVGLAAAVGPVASAGVSLTERLQLRTSVSALVRLPQLSFAVEGATPQFERSLMAFSLGIQLAYTLQ